jgi:hypothetical protein
VVDNDGFPLQRQAEFDDVPTSTRLERPSPKGCAAPPCPSISTINSRPLAPQGFSEIHAVLRRAAGAGQQGQSEGDGGPTDGGGHDMTLDPGP